MFNKLKFLPFDLPIFIILIIRSLISPKEIYNKKLIPKLNINKKLLIIANGPSLKKDIKRIRQISESCDVFAVNYFALSEYFYEIKPDFYFLFDQKFWSKKVNDKIISNANSLVEKLSNINWDMVLICNEVGYSKLKVIAKRNKHVTLIKVRNNPCDLKLESLHLFAINNYICTPNFGRNVFILALWYALLIGKNNIEIYGADFSQFKEFEIDQKNNNTLTNESHFYPFMDGIHKNQSKYKIKKERKIHQRIYEISLMFKQIYLLSKIAEKNNVRVVNYSSSSYLDCFRRPKNNDLII